MQFKIFNNTVTLTNFLNLNELFLRLDHPPSDLFFAVKFKSFRNRDLIMEVIAYYCRMCKAKDENFEFIPVTGRNTHLKIKFEKCFGIIVRNLMKIKTSSNNLHLISARSNDESLDLSSLC